MQVCHTYLQLLVLCWDLTDLIRSVNSLDYLLNSIHDPHKLHSVALLLQYDLQRTYFFSIWTCVVLTETCPNKHYKNLVIL